MSFHFGAVWRLWLCCTLDMTAACCGSYRPNSLFTWGSDGHWVARQLRNGREVIKGDQIVLGTGSFLWFAGNTVGRPHINFFPPFHSYKRESLYRVCEISWLGRCNASYEILLQMVRKETWQECQTRGYLRRCGHSVGKRVPSKEGYVSKGSKAKLSCRWECGEALSPRVYREWAY